MHYHKGPTLIQIAPLERQISIQHAKHGHQAHDRSTEFLVGLDVGSTTVKAVVIDAATDKILWQDYQRHDTKQPEKVLEFLKRFEFEVDDFAAKNSRMFITGSGGNGMTKFLGAKFVQEVNAV